MFISNAILISSNKRNVINTLCYRGVLCKHCQCDKCQPDILHAALNGEWAII